MINRLALALNVNESRLTLALTVCIITAIILTYTTSIKLQSNNDDVTSDTNDNDDRGNSSKLNVKKDSSSSSSKSSSASKRENPTNRIPSDETSNKDDGNASTISSTSTHHINSCTTDTFRENNNSISSHANTPAAVEISTNNETTPVKDTCETPTKPVSDVELTEFVLSLRYKGIQVKYMSEYRNTLKSDPKVKSIRLNADGELYWSKESSIKKIKAMLSTKDSQIPLKLNTLKEVIQSHHDLHYIILFFKATQWMIGFESVAEAQAMQKKFTTLIRRLKTDSNYCSNIATPIPSPSSTTPLSHSDSPSTTASGVEVSPMKSPLLFR